MSQTARQGEQKTSCVPCLIKVFSCCTPLKIESTCLVMQKCCTQPVVWSLPLVTSDDALTAVASSLSQLPAEACRHRCEVSAPQCQYLSRHIRSVPGRRLNCRRLDLS